MSLSESDIRAKLIDPTLHAPGWTEDLIRREETVGTIEIVGGKARRCTSGRVDYTLRVKVSTNSQPVAVALIEAKAEHLSPTNDFNQGKLYANAKRLHVPFVFATKGHRFVMFARFSGQTTSAAHLAEFPTPRSLLTRYEVGMGFDLTDLAACPLLTPYSVGNGGRGDYQNSAIRAVLERIAQSDTRIPLALATGTGKTFFAVNLLLRIAVVSQLRRAVFVYPPPSYGGPSQEISRYG